MKRFGVALLLLVSVFLVQFSIANAESLEARIFVEQSTPGLDPNNCTIEYAGEPARIALVSMNGDLLVTKTVPQGRPGSTMVNGKWRDGCHFEFPIDVPSVPAFHIYFLDGVVRNIGFAPATRTGYFEFSVDTDPEQMVDRDRFFVPLSEEEESPAHPPFDENGGNNHGTPDYPATIEALEQEVEDLKATIEAIATPD